MSFSLRPWMFLLAQVWWSAETSATYTCGTGDRYCSEIEPETDSCVHTHWVIDNSPRTLWSWLHSRTGQSTSLSHWWHQGWWRGRSHHPESSWRSSACCSCRCPPSLAHIRTQGPRTSFRWSANTLHARVTTWSQVCVCLYRKGTGTVLTPPSGLHTAIVIVCSNPNLGFNTFASIRVFLFFLHFSHEIVIEAEHSGWSSSKLHLLILEQTPSQSNKTSPGSGALSQRRCV